MKLSEWFYIRKLACIRWNLNQSERQSHWRAILNLPNTLDVLEAFFRFSPCVKQFKISRQKIEAI